MLHKLPLLYDSQPLCRHLFNMQADILRFGMLQVAGGRRMACWQGFLGHMLIGAIAHVMSHHDLMCMRRRWRSRAR